ncbi:MAG: hypothetical protein ABI542_01070 [Gemmatimonadota bacterium]
MVRTYAEILAGEGLVLRPGAVEQVTGASVDWALRTLLEGHGRHDVLERVPELELRIRREWEGFASSGLLRAAPKAESAWDRVLKSGLPVLLLFGGDPSSVPELLSGLGLSQDPRVEVGGSGPTGLPRSDAISRWLAAADLPAASVRAAVRSPSAALGAGGAGLGEICFIGVPGTVHGMLPVDATVQDLEAFVER